MIISFSFPGSRSGEAESQSEWTDVQKKITPWKNNAPDLDLELVFQDRVAKLGKSISRLIVVASLIDKPTNVGGKITGSQGAGLKSSDPENLCSVQCHCARFPHLTLLGSYGGMCGRREPGGGLPTVTAARRVQGCAGPARCLGPRRWWWAACSASQTSSSKASASQQSSGCL